MSIETSKNALLSAIDGFGVALVERFDPRNLLFKRSGKDADGNYTIFEYSRLDGTLFKKEVLSDLVSGQYQFKSVDYFKPDGVTIVSTVMYELIYDGADLVEERMYIPGPVMTPYFEDTFDGASGTSLSGRTASMGGTWGTEFGNYESSSAIPTNGLLDGSGGVYAGAVGGNFAFWGIPSASSPVADQYTEVKFTGPLPASGAGISIYSRMTAIDGGTYYDIKGGYIAEIASNGVVNLTAITASFTASTIASIAFDFSTLGAGEHTLAFRTNDTEQVILINGVEVLRAADTSVPPGGRRVALAAKRNPTSPVITSFSAKSI